MSKLPPPTAQTIRVTFENVRTRILPLLQRWRMRRFGAELQQLFEALASAIDRSPDGGPAVIDATQALGGLLQMKALLASAIIDPVLDALHELHALLTSEMAVIQTNIATMTPDEVVEFQAAMAAEGARQAGLPPSDADGAHCPICAVLERQKQRRAS